MSKQWPIIANFYAMSYIKQDIKNETVLFIFFKNICGITFSGPQAFKREMFLSIMFKEARPGRKMRFRKPIVIQASLETQEALQEQKSDSCFFLSVVLENLLL